ncbi:MAG: NAD(P)/FAD-dependent oxidoreductase [Actinomyces sp.]|nr:MAG: NAD(P)/FAD-dependent oxidoreductase [Actinomyces sp.]
MIVGAGISGIGAAHHLQRRCPERSYLILEARDSLGGTWDLFRYPGVRSDSDMHTLGFSFKPWTDAKAIADGPSILAYLKETAAEAGIDRHIRYRHRVERAEWDSTTATWTLTVRVGDGEARTYTCNVLLMASGYYSYRAGHTPEFPGRERFGGRIVHPQFWPEDLDHTGKRVIVIGSGATAMTLVPAMAADAAHVVMLQRSPTWVVARPDTDPVANALRRVLPERLAYRLVRRKNIWLQQFFYKRTRTQPAKVRERLLAEVRKHLPPDFDVERHFTPSYDPWDQRLCLLPNGDLFAALQEGKASVVTDEIETFTETGIRCRSGEHLEADIIVTATGLELCTPGEMTFVVDGEEVDFSTRWTYKGLAYSDIPNVVSFFGYINASWTLRVDITADFVCRMLEHADAVGADTVTPRLRPTDADMTPRPLIDGFSPGYMKRAMPRLPKQGDREPWINPQLYERDRALIVESPVDDGVLTFTRSPAGAWSGPPVAAPATGTAPAAADPEPVTAPDDGVPA